MFHSKVKLSLSLKYPTNLVGFITGDKWLQSRRVDDGAEGLWRIHDGLYDVSDFVQFHPGGSSWLEMTKGTDVTEAFEAHHLSSTPEHMLKKFFIRNATKPRNYPFTFEEDGFYRTLKRNIQPILKDIPKNAAKTTDIATDLLLIGTFFSAICASAFWSFAIGIVSGLLLTLTSIAAHNYLHRRDNFRMYYFNLSLMDFRGWRISHALSHHLYANTINDLEMITWEAFAPHFPMKKSFIFKCWSSVSIIILWITIVLMIAKTRVIFLSDLIPLTLPLAMFLVSGVNFQAALKMWLFIIIISSFTFSAIGFNASHHHPDVFHEGDAPRQKRLDWGIHQLDTAFDRREINGNWFWVLTMFGDHALHHIFPTIDHTALPYLHPVFEKTMKEFGVDLQIKSQVEMIIGQFRQLHRETPNPLPPGSRNVKK
ncbi:hypothetical protein RI129_010396 [Pyrocoelia pectoralis]|uniref:Cytochrome b5-related protein n=1 Tax=Pyrocoelia pectoralis TaxID=417401 RepID=A0AAN7VDC9_9COLE